MKINNATVLVVDDDDALREVIVHVLARLHLKTKEASNGKDALEIVKTNQIHIVVSDIKMPGGDGVELLKKIREIDSKMPILIFVSGYCDLSPATAVSLGARRLFEKPFDRSEFINEILTSVAEIAEPL